MAYFHDDPVMGGDAELGQPKPFSGKSPVVAKGLRPSDNLWVGDLPADIDKDQLLAVFEAYGSVVDCRVMPMKPGQNGCAMVRFSTLDEATWVVENLNGNVAQGLSSPIVVRYANAPGGGKGWVSPTASNGKSPVAAKGLCPSPCGGVGGGGGGGWAVGGGKGGGKAERPGSSQTLLRSMRQAGALGAGRVPAECQLYVNNLPADMTDLDLFRLFAPFGAITGVTVMCNEDGSCKGFGFVDYIGEEHAKLAVTSLNGVMCQDGGCIYISTKIKNAAKGVAPKSQEGL